MSGRWCLFHTPCWNSGGSVAKFPRLVGWTVITSTPLHLPAVIDLLGAVS